MAIVVAAKRIVGVVLHVIAAFVVGLLVQVAGIISIDLLFTGQARSLLSTINLLFGFGVMIYLIYRWVWK
jgi:hypothetical protein